VAVESPEGALLVFAQRDAPRAEVAAWDAHGARFFRTRIALADDARSPEERALRLVVAPSACEAGTRTVFGRRREAEDLALAQAAEARTRTSGLAALAARCPTVWLIAREGEPDALALSLAAVLASVLLGPILDLRAGEIYGVKTARAKLDALRSQDPGSASE
jgi:hypothetical protein